MTTDAGFARLFERGEEVLKEYFAHEDATARTTAVVVALPSQVDPIRLVGEEPKHATLLFFGETASLPSNAKEVLLQTLEQVSKMAEPFSEVVVDVSRLGDDTPPALVAMLTNRKLGLLRETLQVNPDVKKYLSNATQHPQFTPHVTLGYPDYHGETDLRKLVSSVRRIWFDRLALWWNDEQVEFDLNSINMEKDVESVGWSEIKHQKTAGVGKRAIDELFSDD